MTRPLKVVQWTKVKKQPVSKTSFWSLQQIPSYNCPFIWQETSDAIGADRLMPSVFTIEGDMPGVCILGGMCLVHLLEGDIPGTPIRRGCSWYTY